MQNKDEMQPIELNGEKFFTIQQFARLVSRSEQCIYGLIARGNSVRKLKTLSFLGKPLIFATELTQFPFTTQGRGAKDNIYFHDDNGNVIERE